MWMGNLGHYSEALPTSEYEQQCQGQGCHRARLLGPVTGPLPAGIKGDPCPPLLSERSFHLRRIYSTTEAKACASRLLWPVGWAGTGVIPQCEPRCWLSLAPLGPVSGPRGLLHTPALTVGGALAGPWKAPWVLPSPGHFVASAGFRGPSALSAHPMRTTGLGAEARSGIC